MIINFDEYLLERKQGGLLYHYTSLNGFYGIMESNMIGSEVYEYTSLTRDKMFHKYKRIGVSTSIRITLDGDRITDTYKITPYTYFKGSKDPHGKRFSMDTTESEERLKGAIVDVSKYIVAIDIFPNMVTKFDFRVMVANKELNDIITPYYTDDNKLDPTALTKYIGYVEGKFNMKFNIINDETFSKTELRYDN